MTTMPEAVTTRPTFRQAGWLAIASGIVGFISIACLVAYLTTQVDEFIETGVMPPLGKVFITSNYVGYAIQALLMVPVALVLHALGRQRLSTVSAAAVVVGVIALIAIAVLRLLPLANASMSDILFMGPMGFAGMWLIVVNLLLKGELSGALRITGIVAGTGFVIMGASFFFLGGLAVLTDGPFAYGNDVDFHAGIRIGGFPAFFVFPIWTILLGRKLLRPRES